MGTEGYTGSRYELAGIVHYGQGFTRCSCGSLVEWQGSAEGESYLHYDPFASWKEHIFATPEGGRAKFG